MHRNYQLQLNNTDNVFTNGNMMALTIPQINNNPQNNNHSQLHNHQSFSVKKSSRSHLPQFQNPHAISRFNTANTIHLQPQSQQQMKKLILNLQKSLIENQQQKRQLQEKLQLHIKRSFDRQRQFHKIIDHFINTKTQLFGNSPIFSTQKDKQQEKHRNMYRQIVSIHSQLNQKVQENDEQLRSKYEQYYQENVKLMERKITQLVEKMEYELTKTKKQMQSQQGTQIKETLVKVEQLAVGVQASNIQLTQKNKQLQIKLQIVMQQRNLLIEQLTQKKLLIKKYYSQYKTLQKNKQKQKQTNLITDQNDGNFKQTIENNRTILAKQNTINLNRDNDKLNEQKMKGKASIALTTVNSKSISLVNNKSRNINTMNYNNKRRFTLTSQSSSYVETNNKKYINNTIDVRVQSNNRDIQVVMNKSKNNKSKPYSYYLASQQVLSMPITRASSPKEQLQTFTKDNDHQNKNTIVINDKLKATSTMELADNRLQKFNNSRKNSRNQISLNSRQKQGLQIEREQRLKLKQTQTIRSIRNIASREKHKKVQYQSRLNQARMKLVSIDRLVDEALSVLGRLKEQQERQMKDKHKNFQIGQQTQQEQRRKDILGLMGLLCNQIKNILANYGNYSNNGINIDSNYMESFNNDSHPKGFDSRQINRKELISLLDGQLFN